MNIKDISTKISNPNLCSSNDIDSFSKLNESYPYAQIFSILYLKSLSNDDALFFDEALYKNAYKITDRSKLYHFLNETTILKEKEFKNENPLDSVLLVVDEEEIEEELVNDVTVETTNQSKENELDIEIISHVISHAFSEEVENDYEKEINEKIDSNESLKQNTLILEAKTPEDKHTSKKFSEWLKKGDKSKKDLPKKSINNIINSFIEIEPSISKPKKEFYSPVKQAQKSVDDDSVVYSETLASILALQGNYPRAIIAYEQLCLTIPEKKVYFVQKINELKEKLTT
jgi:hypothetical protein